MKRLVAALLAISLTVFAISAYADVNIPEADEEVSADVELSCMSAVLMDSSSGRILYSKGEDYYNSPASVTKVMTLLLVMEALERGEFSLSDEVMISEYASSMGGSQVFLKAGERMTVEELIKCTVIASANDAAVALAELVSGSEAAFVKRMNEKAKELGLKKTSFENSTGLDDDTVEHYSCASDIAIMSRELIKHELITEYSSLWQDSIRNGEFILTNTNRLVRFYDGCNGLKTGSTDKAGYCITVSAKRGDTELIAVIMNAPSLKERNSDARALLDYGFYGYAPYSFSGEDIPELSVSRGTQNKVRVGTDGFSMLLPKSDIKNVTALYEIPECIDSPVVCGEVVGKAIFKNGDQIIGECELYALESVDRISFFELFSRIMTNIFI